MFIGLLVLASLCMHFPQHCSSAFRQRNIPLVYCKASANTTTQESNQTCCIFLYGIWDKNFLTCLYGKKNVQRRIIIHEPWKLYETPVSASISEVLLRHGHMHSFMCGIWRISCYLTELSSCTQTMWPIEAATYQCVLSGPSNKACLLLIERPWVFHNLPFA